MVPPKDSRISFSNRTASALRPDSEVETADDADSTDKQMLETEIRRMTPRVAPKEIPSVTPEIREIRGSCFVFSFFIFRF